jgi:hypothetical protein
MEEAQKPAEFEWTVPEEGTPEIYGNFVNVSWTLFDVRFRIGQLIPRATNPKSGFVVEQQCAVTIAWPEAKLLRDMLTELVSKYESVNGEFKPLTLPPGTP